MRGCRGSVRVSVDSWYKGAEETSIWCFSIQRYPGLEGALLKTEGSILFRISIIATPASSTQKTMQFFNHD